MLRDILLILTLFFSMAIGILWPSISSFFQIFPLYCMMSLLFLSFLPIKIEEIWTTIYQRKGIIIYLWFIKMFILPVTIYYLFKIVLPLYAPSALLLSAISTGVVAPFISNLVGANTPLVLIMVVISSVTVPFTLPIIIAVILARSVEISLVHMIRILSLIIFIPITTVQLLRTIRPSLISKIMKRQFPISLVLFSIINLGIFSRYSSFFYQKPEILAGALGITFILSALYFVSGLIFLPNQKSTDKMAAIITFGNMNNVLLVVFSSRFFGPLEPTVAALYLVPFFVLILPLRLYERRFNK